MHQHSPFEDLGHRNGKALASDASRAAATTRQHGNASGCPQSASLQDYVKLQPTAFPLRSKARDTNEAELKPLMIAGLGGDAAAHRTLLEKLSGYLRAFYRSKLVRAARTAEATEDLVQEALMAVHTKRHTYDPGELLTPWVYAIARYKLIDYLRRTRASMTDVPIEDAGEIVAHNDHDAAESALDLARLLARLPDKMRLAIQYVKLDGHSVADAATRCGISESAIKINVHRGLKILAASVAQGRKHEDG